MISIQLSSSVPIPEDKEVLKALYYVNDNLNLYYRLSEMPEEELAAVIDRYHLQ